MLFRFLIEVAENGISLVLTSVDSVFVEDSSIVTF